MSGFLLVALIAIMGGIAVALQAQFMGLMDQNIGTMESVFITYGSGGVLVGLIMLLLRGGNLKAWTAVPWYALLAGVVGLVIVGSIGYAVPRLGLVPAFTIFVATQFIVSALLDHFGLLGAPVRPLDLTRLAGVFVLLSGIWLIMR